MRAAPAVTLRFAPGAAVRWPVAWLSAAVLVVVTAAAFRWSGITSAWSAAGVGGAVLLAGLTGMGAALWWARREHPVDLSFDGRDWWWQSLSEQDAAVPAPATGTRLVVGVALDLDRWMLLRTEPAPQAGPRAAPRWLALRRDGFSPGRWHAFRSAVYCAPSTSSLGDPGIRADT